MPLEGWVLHLAERLVEFVTRETGYQALVCDETGTIVRATVHRRIGDVHSAAQKIMGGDCDEYAVTAEEAAANSLVREGVSCPIAVDGRRVGTFGVTGPLLTARPLARLAALILATWMKETKQQRDLRQTAERVFGTLGQNGVKGGGAPVDARRLAQQSRILATLSLMVGNMARRVDELRETAAAAQIQLGECARGLPSEGARAVQQAQKTLDRAAASAADQARTLKAVTETLASLKRDLAGLEASGALDPGAD